MTLRVMSYHKSILNDLGKEKICKILNIMKIINCCAEFLFPVIMGCITLLATILSLNFLLVFKIVCRNV